MTLTREKGKGPAAKSEITVCIADNKMIREFNLMFLGRNLSTDVIAFDMTDRSRKPGISADIIISAQEAAANSKTFKSELWREIYLYVIHGVLHVLGYTDEKASDRKVMENKANLLLSDLCPSKKPKH